MPRVMLREVGGSVFDSWHQANAGRTQVYWIDPSLAGSVAQDLATRLAACDAALHLVASAPPPHVGDTGLSWLVDPTGELRSAVGAARPVGVVVDANGRVAAIMPTPVPDVVVALATTLYAASAPTVVLNQAPVLDRVLEPPLCAALVDHWQRGNKLVDGVASIVGANRADADIKRRVDVPLDDNQLFVLVRDCLVRRLMLAILQAFHSRVVQIEMPCIGCYDVSYGGWFRRHRDNTTPYTVHRQFALSLNLNADTEYDGGQVRFPEFGRQLYRPAAGGAMVFSCSLLHEAMRWNIICAIARSRCLRVSADARMSQGSAFADAVRVNATTMAACIGQSRTPNATVTRNADQTAS